MADILMTGFSDGNILSYLPLAVVLTPVLGSLLLGLLSIKNKAFGPQAAVIIAAATLYLTFELFLLALKGYSISYRLPDLAGIALFLKVDLSGAVFALFTTFIWLLACLASLPYLKDDQNKNRYYVFLILSLGGCTGVFLGGDFLSLFLFFELMTFSAYALVVHNQTPAALKAGANYLYLSIIGGLALLAGIIILNSFTGNVALAQQAPALQNNSARALLIALLMIGGFGVKAGMMPLHIWLPQAHPVAPAPASALLSGIMIKTGAYGIIRVVTMLYTPPLKLAAGGFWYLAENLGHFIIWMGIITMFFAALLAIVQNNAKRLLAYSSISQMGYILVGIGAAAYLGYDGALAFGSFSYHIINHAFFKAGLFILFGIVYTRLHEVNMDKLGGLWRKLPFTFAAFLVCAFGITGVPGFNGYISKTLLHHAIVEAYAHHQLLDLWVAEKLFVIASGLTVCYIVRLVITVFCGPLSASNANKLAGGPAKESWLEKLIAFVFAAAVVLLGLNPGFMLNRIVGPMSSAFTYDEQMVSYLTQTTFWNFSDLMGIIVAFIIGLLVYLLAVKKDLFGFKPPLYLSVERSLYRPATAVLEMAFTRTGRLLDDSLNQGFHSAPLLLHRVSLSANSIDTFLFSKGGLSVLNMISSFLNCIYESWIKLIKAVFGRIGVFLRKAFMTLFKFDYSAKGDHRFQVFNIGNIDFDLYIVLIVIGVILAASFFLFF